MARWLLFRIPLFLSLKELDPSPRRFLFFTCFNVVSWQCIAGAALVLFARHIGMPASWVGCLISFLPLSSLLVLLNMPLLKRLGSKKLMLTAWLLRNLITCSVFTMPFAIAIWGERAAWYVLTGATLGFCLMRAIGAGGWFPWLHELVSEEQRGTFFSAEVGVAQFVSVLVSVCIALALHGDPGLARHLTIYGCGIVAGMLSLLMMARIPGGGTVMDASAREGTLRSYAGVLRDWPYVRFVLVASVGFSAISWQGSASVLFMRDAIGLNSNTIMYITAAASCGVFFTIRYWARFAEFSGSGRAMFKGLAGYATVALLFLGMAPQASWTRYVLPPAVVLAAVSGAAFSTSSHRAMLNQVPFSGKIAYTNLWTFGNALALGVTPIVAGTIIDRWGLAGFRVCFAVSFIGTSIAAVMSVLTVERRIPLRRPLWTVMNPLLPLRTLGYVLLITFGLHESNRIGGRGALDNAREGSRSGERDAGPAAPRILTQGSSSSTEKESAPRVCVANAPCTETDVSKRAV